MRKMVGTTESTTHDNIYEREISCNAGEMYIDVASTNFKANQTQADKNKSKYKKYWRGFECVVVLLLLIVAVVGIYYISRLSINSDGVYGSSKNPAASCLSLRSTGVSTDGYYIVQPIGTKEPIRVYCDMTTAGGGWTLVASVHENNLAMKCTSADMWFSNEPAQYAQYERNWENTNTFGNVEEATSADYKNLGYSSIKASNVMIRHVPNKTPLDKSKSLASLEYHTSNNFLTKYGGNLYTTYTQHYPMNPKTTASYPSNIGQMADSIASISNELTSAIPDYHKYEYGSSGTQLHNAPNGTFTNYGMEITTSCVSYIITYGTEYKCTSGNSVMTSRKSSPFIGLMAVTNSNKQKSLKFSILSYRSNTEPVQLYDGKMSNGNFELQYRARCVHGGNIPSVCDVGFVVSNVKDWFSSSSITLTGVVTGTINNYRYDVNLNDYPRNVMFGYTMLSRRAGGLVSKEQLTTVLEKVLKTFKNHTWSISCAANHLVVPVTYTIGESTLTNFVPPSMHHATTTGFLQIRAESYSGTYYAMCPAVRVNWCEGEFVCVGGVKLGSVVSDDCNDFTNWDGNTNAQDFHHSIGYAHSTKDIQSTIMIFYR